MFRGLLEILGWPRTPDRVQAYVSPRLGVSFPITEKSKMYFNYGHFYQRPAISFMYNLAIYPGSVTVPTPNLTMGKTVSYEFGYEQIVPLDILFNVTAYYKDVTNEPLVREFINYYHDNIVDQYFPDAYSDVRGFELRLERPIGNWVTFSAMYHYMIQSSGETGLAKVYENLLEASDALRSADLTTTQPIPRANVNLNLHSPNDFGPSIGEFNLLGSIYLNFFFEWHAGGQMLWNPQEPDMKNWIWVDRVNYWNIDFRGSKSFTVGPTTYELVVTIQNLTNNKWLIPENMLRTQYDASKSLFAPPLRGRGWNGQMGPVEIG